MRYFVPVLAALLLFPLQAVLNTCNAGELEIGRMRVAIWPEYDSSGVLFIYDGKFKNNESFPAQTSFLLPEKSVISDACSLSPSGTHFCQLFKQKKTGPIEEVTLKLPYPDFYLSFHTDPFGQEGKKTLHHVIRASHAIDKLEVDVQGPLRAEGFRVAGDGYVKSEAKGFEHYTKIFENVGKGEEIPVDIEYTKMDNRPSVDIKYSPMSDKSNSSPYQRQRGFMSTAYVVVLAGFAVLAVLLIVAFRRGKKDA